MYLLSIHLCVFTARGNVFIHVFFPLRSVSHYVTLQLVLFPTCSSFLPAAGNQSMVYPPHVLLIRACTNEHSGCFRFSFMMNNPAAGTFTHAEGVQIVRTGTFPGQRSRNAGLRLVLPGTTKLPFLF